MVVEETEDLKKIIPKSPAGYLPEVQNSGLQEKIG